MNHHGLFTRIARLNRPLLFLNLLLLMAIVFLPFSTAQLGANILVPQDAPTAASFYAASSGLICSRTRTCSRRTSIAKPRFGPGRGSRSDCSPTSSVCHLARSARSGSLSSAPRWPSITPSSGSPTSAAGRQTCFGGLIRIRRSGEAGEVAPGFPVRRCEGGENRLLTTALGPGQGSESAVVRPVCPWQSRPVNVVNLRAIVPATMAS